jgi:hypothetical protein
MEQSEHFWRGGNEWKMRLCPKDYEDFRQWKGDNSLPEDYSEDDDLLTRP